MVWIKYFIYVFLKLVQAKIIMSARRTIKYNAAIDVKSSINMTLSLSIPEFLLNNIIKAFANIAHCVDEMNTRC